MIKVEISDTVMTCENPKESEIFMKLNMPESHERGHEGTECVERGHEGTECVETDGQNSSNFQTTKRGNENQPAEDSSKPHLSDTQQSEILFINMRTEIHHERGHEGKESVEADAQCTDQTPIRGDESQPAEDNSKPHQSEDVNSLKAKEKELQKEIYTLSTQMRTTAESCMTFKKENKNMLKELKKELSKDEFSKLEAMNPDGNSESLDDDDDKHCQNSSESPDKSNSSTDGNSYDDGDSDSLTPIQIEKE